MTRKGAWAETHETGTCTWKIVEVPDKKCLLSEKYERKEIVMPTFEIYYSDLNEAAQKRLLEAVNVESASDMNWDCDILPIALFEFEKEEGNEYFSSSSGKIQQFLASKEDSYAILQLRYSDETASERFMSLKSLEKMKLKPVFEHYEVTYVSPLPPYEDRNEMLEKLYMQFNVSRPDDFKGHSLSVSDIIALRENGVVTCHFVDSIGFKELPRFFKPALQ